MTTYFIGGTWAPVIEVHLEGVPPCLWCGDPVHSPSCDGPLVCAACDCGRNKDGSKWTSADYEEKRRHFNAKISEYKELHAKRGQR